MTHPGSADALCVDAMLDIYWSHAPKWRDCGDANIQRERMSRVIAALSADAPLSQPTVTVPDDDAAVWILETFQQGYVTDEPEIKGFPAWMVRAIKGALSTAAPQAQVTGEALART